MAAPGLLEYGRPAATSDWIVGPLIATFACILDKNLPQKAMDGSDFIEY